MDLDLETNDKQATKVNNNGKSGKTNYTREELLSLFAIMGRIQPIGTKEWEQVQLEHSKQHPGRDVESIRRKYNSLHRKQVITGAPNIPPEILAAKVVKRKIGLKAEIGGDEEENFNVEVGFTEVQDPTQPAVVPFQEHPMNQPEVPPAAAAKVPRLLQSHLVSPVASPRIIAKNFLR